MLTAIGSLLAEVSYFVGHLVAAVTLLVIKLVEVILFELIPLVIQVVLWGLNILSNSIVYLTLSAYYVLRLLLEAVVQLDWQYALDILSEALHSLSTGVVACGSAIFAGIKIVLSFIALFLSSVCVFVWKTISFILVNGWNLCAYLGRTAAAIIIGGGKLISDIVFSATIPMQTVRNGIQFVFFAVFLIVSLVIILQCTLYTVRKVWRCFKNISIKLANANIRQSNTNRPRVDIGMRANESVDRERIECRAEDFIRPPALSSPRFRRSHSSDKDSKALKLKKELEGIKKELEKHQEEKLCVVCYDNPRVIVVHPCNHYCLCANCRNQLRKCPVCNKYIQSSEKIFNV